MRAYPEILSPGTRRRVASLAIATLCLGVAAFASEDASVGLTHALLINGGSKPASNYQSHLHHLEDMVAFLQRRGLPRDRIHVFSADGEDPTPDLAVRDTLPPEFYLLEGTSLGRKLRPRTELTDTRWQGQPLHPASKEALREWFEEARERLAPNDRLFLFVTDHGTENRDDADNGSISLWNEDLTVRELKELLALLPPGVRTVMVMSQCFSGTFASAMFDDGASEPSGGVCGFFSTTRDQPAYGCYPEGRDRDRIGHAFRFIEALDRQGTTSDAHREVLVTDSTPDVPLRTSDAYLEGLLAAEAGSRGVDVDALTDELLKTAWRDRAAWESEIRLLDRLGEAFGAFSPRSLAEIASYDREMPTLIRKLRAYARRWDLALGSVKEGLLKSFLEERPDWRKQVSDEAIEALTLEERKAVLADLLPLLASHARSRTETWARFEDLRDRGRRASEGAWRLQVRRSVLDRMRAVLTGIAARILLAQEEEATARPGEVPERMQALERLETCEAFSPGRMPASHPAGQVALSNPFPPLTHELALLAEVLPSWLGVRFDRMPRTLLSGRDLPGGASWLRAVYPDSPALEAGLQAGDVLLGPPGQPFAAFGDLREWTMTSPRDTPLRLIVLRPGAQPGEDLEFEATVSLRPLPLEWPKLPGPPQVGEAAPPLPDSLLPVGRRRLRHLEGRPHVLFFWATWCEPCKAAVAEVLAYARAERLAVLAITDEDSATVAGYLKARQEAFFRQVAADPLRQSFLAYGVSGTPTIVVVDADGIVRHRQVGYNFEKGLTVDGWSWSRP